MNRFKTILAMLAFVLLAISCQKDDTPKVEYLDVTPNNISGNWKLVEWNGVSYDDSMPYVYITLDSKEQTFKLYSNMDSYYPVLRTGNFDMEYDNDLQYNILTGYYDYSFGFFQYDYRVLLQDNDTMIWIAIGAEDKCIYTRTDLPEGLE